MYAFAYWHTYYDSAFLYHPFKLSPALFQDLNITNAHLSRWPALSILPELPQMFESLERFMLEEGNWIGCMCSEEEMEIMQSNINSLVLYLQCEKQYGFQFWGKSRRRIQASIVHFVVFVKRLVFAIIPEDCRNLLEAHRAEKLIMEMGRIEGFINEIIAIMQPIHSFLFGIDFQEEEQLTQEFFEEFNTLIQHLPKVKRTKLVKAPKLMDYICVVNPIEAQCFEFQKDDHIRRKSATVLQRPRTTKKHSIQKHSNSKNFKVVNNSIVKIKDKKHSLDKNIFDKEEQALATLKNYQFFKFKDKVRKYSFYNKSKKQTLASIETKEKTASIEKDRSRSHDRSLTMSPQIKMKSRTLANDIRAKEESIVIDRRSRELTSRSIISRNSRSMRRNDIFEGEEIEHERQEKTKKKKAVKLPVRSMRYSQLRNLSDGKAKGWGIIRQFVWKKIAQRRLKRLLL